MNSYTLAGTAPSRPRVCLFHHLGTADAEGAAPLSIVGSCAPANSGGPGTMIALCDKRPITVAVANIEYL